MPNSKLLPLLLPLFTLLLTTSHATAPVFPPVVPITQPKIPPPEGDGTDRKPPVKDHHKPMNLTDHTGFNVTKYFYHEQEHMQREPAGGDTPNSALFPLVKDEFLQRHRPRYSPYLGFILNEIAEMQETIHRAVDRRENSTLHQSAALDLLSKAAKELRLARTAIPGMHKNMSNEIFQLIRALVIMIGLILDPIGLDPPPIHMTDHPWNTYAALSELLIVDYREVYQEPEKLNITWHGQELKRRFRWRRRPCLTVPGLSIGPYT
ncbi:hypothetical protein CDD80_691 [Ophiocordyceps camponoti-rufipedis]|uniref:Uncharacterized protein n=1 Tax=Ophiocordyceps camponoti-rufipedis TaxID=2004952 RepID=A0A2C5ZBW0_9HYPO|nr:hypothetical protein CDD80_691 [Ophiocordyceps camponoti-rufipedis]